MHRRSQASSPREATRSQVGITADGAPPLEDYPVHWVSRSRPPGVRHADTVRLLTSLSRWADVVYTTGMLGRSSLGSLLGRTPFVTKLTADPAYERARRWGIANGSLEEFQRSPGAASLPLRVHRDLDVRRAAHVVTPSAYLRELALGWGVRTGPGDAAAEPGAAAAGARTSRRAAGAARDRGPDARLRRPADGAEVARPRDRSRASRGRRARDRRRRAGPRLARAHRLRAVPRPAAEDGGARALPRRRRVAALLGLGELPAHRGRGPRGGDSGDRDPDRRCRRGARRRRERARRGARRRGCPGRPRSSASSPRTGSPRGSGRTLPPSVVDYAPDRVYSRLERILVAALG